MKERPILFSGPMVRAILEGRKTQTRRVLKVAPSYTLSTQATFTMQPNGNVLLERWPRQEREMNNFGRGAQYPCPYGVTGDRLWVRETFHWSENYEPIYRACIDLGLASVVDHFRVKHEERWVPSIHMPRWASRILLEVTEVRVQRLQEMSEDDALAEGRSLNPNDLAGFFPDTWDSINGKSHPWASNPWVWAITFKRIAPEQK